MAGSVIKEFNKHCKNVLFEITKKFEGVDYKRLELEYDFEKKELVTTGPTESGIDNDEVMWKSYSNPEHIFDIVYEGPLYMLLRHDEYEVKKSDISEEAWEYIFKHTDILSDKVMDWYDCMDVTDLLDQIVMDKFDNPEYSEWDKRLKKLVDYVDSKECFANGVDIPGGICYFMWQADYDGDCEVVNVQKNGTRDIDIRSLNEYQTFVRQNKALSIIKKVKSKKEKIMSDQVQSRRSFGIDSNVKFDKDGDYLMRSSSGYGPVRADKVTSGFDKIDKWKTIISKVTTEHAGVPSKDGKMKVLAVVETLKPQTVCSESYLVTGIFDTEEESNNLEIYLKTKFVRFLMTQMLASMNMSKSTFTFVPVQDFKKLWTDEDLYEKYGLDNSERELIEDAIRPMGDKNG